MGASAASLAITVEVQADKIQTHISDLQGEGEDHFFELGTQLTALEEGFRRRFGWRQTLFREADSSVTLNKTDLLDSHSNVCAVRDLEELKRLIRFALPDWVEADGFEKITKFHLVEWGSELPEDIDVLQKLEVFRLDEWKLRTLPGTISECKSLRVLNIYECNFVASVPESISNLQQLEEFSIEVNFSVKALPQGILACKALRVLSLKFCRALAELPEGIGELKALESLVLIDCSSLTSLPDGISELKELQYLDISGCRSLTALPEERWPEAIAELPKLCNFNCFRCPNLP